MTTEEILAFPFLDHQAQSLDPNFARLRVERPVARVRLPYGGDAWLVTRRAEVTAVLSDPRFSRAEAARPDIPRQTSMASPARTIMDLDRPEHGRLRRLAAHAFADWRIEQLRSYVRMVADELVDMLIASTPPADLVQRFALPLPMTVICHILGVPLVDRERFRAWTEAVVAVRKLPADEYAKVCHELDEYMTELVQQRRRSATDDLLGILVQARDNGNRLSEEELVSFGVTLLAAGYETTASQIANSIVLLLSHPEEWQRLRAEPDSLASTVEELLRIIPLNGGTGLPRVATEDIELAGVTIRKGEAVFVSTISANRDADVFASADRFCPHRSPNPHVTFGYGPHRCLGSRLATMEIQEALRVLTSRVPSLQLAAPTSLEWKKDTLVRGPVAVLVEW